MNIFGTDGIRNRVGTYPLTQDALIRLGRAIALWAQENYGEDAFFLLACDTRNSCSWVKACLTSGMLRYPIKIANAEVLPTPALFHLMKENPQYTTGIMVTASHNLASDNGIKFAGPTGSKLSVKDEVRISELFEQEQSEDQFLQLGQERILSTVQEAYIQKIVSLFQPRFLEGRSIVLDCAQGATYEVAPQIFSRLGADIKVLNDTPNGYNINDQCGALHVEGLRQTVMETHAHLGIAFDGDGDRVIAVTQNGTVKDGDDVLSFLLHHPAYKDLPAVVGTVLSNQGLESQIQAKGKDFIRVPVGDKYIVEALSSKNVMLGGEPIGHIILADIITTGDGILAALKILETMEYTQDYTMRTFERFPQISVAVPIKRKLDLHEPPLSEFLEESRQKLHDGRVVVRYSGTEPLIRVMVEDSDPKLIKHVAESLAKKLQKALS